MKLKIFFAGVLVGAASVLVLFFQFFPAYKNEYPLHVSNEQKSNYNISKGTQSHNNNKDKGALPLGINEQIPSKEPAVMHKSDIDNTKVVSEKTSPVKSKDELIKLLKSDSSKLVTLLKKLSEEQDLNQFKTNANEMSGLLNSPEISDGDKANIIDVLIKIAKNSDNIDIAKEALLSIARYVEGSWSGSFGFFMHHSNTNKLTTEQKADLVSIANSSVEKRLWAIEALASDKSDISVNETIIYFARPAEKNDKKKYLRFLLVRDTNDLLSLLDKAMYEADEIIKEGLIDSFNHFHITKMEKRVEGKLLSIMALAPNTKSAYLALLKLVYSNFNHDEDWKDENKQVYVNKLESLTSATNIIEGDYRASTQQIITALKDRNREEFSRLIRIWLSY